MSIDTSIFYNSDNRFMHNKMGAFLIDTYNLIHLQGQGVSKVDAMKSPVMAYNNRLGIYEQLNREGLDKIILTAIDDLRSNQRNEVISYIKALAEVRPVDKRNIIAFKNCVYDIDNNAVLDRSPKIVSIRACPKVEYNPAIADNKYLDLYMNNLCGSDEDMKNFIYEILGYCLLNSNKLNKFFIIVGEGGNGKSTFLKIITSMFGDNNISRLQLEDIDERFRVSELFGKIINLGDDIEGGQIFKSAQLKKIVTGEPIMGEYKGEKPFSFYPTVKLIFTSNKLPRITDTSEGMNDRIVVIPFVPRFRDMKNVVIDIDKKIEETGGLTCLLNRMIEGVKRINKSGKFTQCKSVIEATSQYLKDNDHIALFIEDVDNGEVEYSNFTDFPNNTHKGSFTIEGTATKEVYEVYRNWATGNGYRPYGSNLFGKGIAKHGYTRVQIGTAESRGKRIYKKA